MEIRWLDAGCVELVSAGARVVVDPPAAPAAPLAAAVARADLVAVSRRALRPDDGKGARWIDGPGEYERAGVFVVGVRTLPARVGPVDEDQLNTAYVFGADDVTVCHLGGLDHVPSEAELDALGRIDVLLLPIGAADGLGPGPAAEIVGKLEPGIVIPLHGARPLEAAPPAEREALLRFVAAMGTAEPAAQDSYRVAIDRQGGETALVVLRPVGA